MKSELIPLETIQNCRDLGSIQNKDGLFIKEKMLIRSGFLVDASQEELQKLYDDYHVRKIIDLRTLTEKKERPDHYLKEMVYLDHSVQQEQEYAATQDAESIRKRKEYFAKLNQEIGDSLKKGIDHMCQFYHYLALDEFANNRYGDFLKEVYNSDGAVLWHCSLGKDRCGIGTVLILSILDVDEDTIMEDYLYTNICLHNRAELNCAQETGMFAHRRYLQTYFDDIKANYGSMQKYLQKLGIGEQEKEMFKQKYLEKR